MASKKEPPSIAMYLPTDQSGPACCAVLVLVLVLLVLLPPPPLLPLLPLLLLLHVPRHSCNWLERRDVIERRVRRPAMCSGTVAQT